MVDIFFSISIYTNLYVYIFICMNSQNSEGCWSLLNHIIGFLKYQNEVL